LIVTKSHPKFTFKYSFVFLLLSQDLLVTTKVGQVSIPSNVQYVTLWKCFSHPCLVITIFLKVMPCWAWFSPPIWCLILSWLTYFAKSRVIRDQNLITQHQLLSNNLVFQPMGCPPIIYTIDVIFGLKKA
jgi:hypothetical protein